MGDVGSLKQFESGGLFECVYFFEEGGGLVLHPCLRGLSLPVGFKPTCFLLAFFVALLLAMFEGRGMKTSATHE